MTERTNIPISENNKIFHTLHYNFSEDRIPLQYAMELNTLDENEAKEKKQQILDSLQIVKRLEEKHKELPPTTGHYHEIGKCPKNCQSKQKIEFRRIKYQIEHGLLQSILKGVTD